MGFDSGGTEQLWNPEVLTDILRVMKDHEPFSRGDSSSPIYDDLEDLYPMMTWKNWGASGDFRPIWRKSNPMIKLGLTTDEIEGATITELGNDVLAGNLNMTDVFVLAARDHREKDGSNSFALLCAAGLELPNREFDYADIEYGVSKSYDPKDGNLLMVLQQISDKGYKLKDTNRRRRIRSILKPLVNSGTFVETKNGWILGDSKQAANIADSTNTLRFDLTGTRGGSSLRSKRKNSFVPVKTENRQTGSFDLSKVGNSDPLKAAIALERSNMLHESTVARLGIDLENLGYSALEDRDSFDLALLDEPASIFEVKTIHPKNAISQVRKAIIQLEEYRWRHRDVFSSKPRLFIVLNLDPTGIIEDHYFDFIELDRKISIIWPTPHFADRQGVELQALLAQPS